LAKRQRPVLLLSQLNIIRFPNRWFDHSQVIYSFWSSSPNAIQLIFLLPDKLSYHILWIWYFKSFRKGFWSNFRRTMTFFLIVIFYIQIVFNVFQIILTCKVTRFCSNSVNTGCGLYSSCSWCNFPEVVFIVVEYVAVAVVNVAAVVAGADTFDDVATSWATFATLVEVDISCEGTKPPVPSPPFLSSRQAAKAPTPPCCCRAPRTPRDLHYRRFPAP